MDPPVKLTSLANGIVTLKPVLVGFHLLETMVPPVGATVPRVKAGGFEVSITSALLAPSDPLAPGAASVNVAAFSATSFIVPLFKVKELVAT